jgi:FAD-dependent urate hydroxylase
VAAGDLRPEVEETVPRVDLSPTQREAIRRREVDARLARDRDAEAGSFDEPLFALGKETRGVRERRDASSEMSLELGLRLPDLVPGLLVVESQQVRVGDGMRFESEGSVTIELDDLRPGEQRRLAGVPVEGRAPVDDPGGDEDRRAKPAPGEHRKRVLGNVAATVVEREADRALRELARGEQRTHLRHVDDVVAFRCEELHLLSKAADGDCELVIVVGDPVVEEKPQPVGGALRATTREPRRRASTCDGRLHGVRDGWNSHAATRSGTNLLRQVDVEMTERLDVAILGAGPYGLSVAAHLRDRTKVRLFGQPMQTWRTRMPPDMRLRSDWSETSFSAPDGAGTFDRWAKATGEAREEPIPLQKFLRYAEWFRTSFVGDLDTSDVASVDRANGTFRITTGQGDEVDARMLVIAVGAVPFASAPTSIAGELGEDVRFATDLQDYSAYASRRVVVVGGGQGGLESALLAARAGADVQMVIRSRLHWFADREPHSSRSALGQRLYRLAYPVVGYGPPPLNRLVLHPDLFSALPRPVRRKLTARVLRAGGSPWLREAIERQVRIIGGVSVEALERSNGDLRVRLSDGSAVEADAVIVAAGFRFSLDRLSFLTPDIRATIELDEGWPVLDRWFRSTDPKVLFVGFASEHRFGPIVRFIPGTRFSGPRVEELLTR